MSKLNEYGIFGKPFRSESSVYLVSFMFYTLLQPYYQTKPISGKHLNSLVDNQKCLLFHIKKGIRLINFNILKTKSHSLYTIGKSITLYCKFSN